PLAVGEHDPVAAGTELGAFRILDSRIGSECRFLRGSRDLQRLIRLDYSAIRIAELKVGERFWMKQRVGQARPGIGCGQARERYRVGHELRNRTSLQLGRRCGRGCLSDEDAET